MYDVWACFVLDFWLYGHSLQAMQDLACQGLIQFCKLVKYTNTSIDA